jgi:hypothetical protein
MLLTFFAVHVLTGRNFSWGEQALLSQLGKNRAGRNGVEKFQMALPNRQKISKVTE